MTHKTFIEIMKNDNDGDWEGDNAFLGLQIISKYTSKIIQGASHDVIFSEDIENLIEAGITKEDVKELRRLNWMVEDDTYLACFV